MNITSPSINPDEVEKFSRMAEDWWNPNGKFKPLHKFNPVRIKFIRDTLVKHFNLNSNSTLTTQLSTLSILDIGCGGGLLTIPLTRLGAQVTGIDASEKNIKIAKAYAETQNLTPEYINISAEELASQGRKFDVILNMEVIEHVADVESFMSASAALLKPNGLMFVATMNRTTKSYLTAIIGAEYVLRWLPRGTHDWKKFLKPHEINNEFEKNNIKLLESIGVKYNPIRDEFFTDPDLSTNFIMVGKKL